MQRRAQEVAEQFPVRPSNQLGVVGVPTQTVRDKAERQASEDHGDPVIPLNKYRSGRGSMTSGGGFSTSVRDRQSVENHRREEVAPASSEGDYWLNLHKQREAEEKAAELELIRTKKLIIL
jgi:hypothetical protein